MKRAHNLGRQHSSSSAVVQKDLVHLDRPQRRKRFGIALRVLDAAQLKGKRAQEGVRDAGWGGEGWGGGGGYCRWGLAVTYEVQFISITLTRQISSQEVIDRSACLY